VKIYVFDSWRKFWTDAIRYWEAQGHEVKTGIYWGTELTDWADVAIFHPCENNLIQASKTSKPPDTVVIAEAVDIDIYSNHPGAVNWEYVDALVFYAQHMREYAEARFKFPHDLPRTIVPGGVDLVRWTLRTGPRGYNVAWIGRLWIAKNIFSALQVFHQLIKADPAHPWRLSCLGEKWHPDNWWRLHCQSYLEAYPALAERVEFVQRVDDVNVWLDDKDYLLQTSYKEAFGYVIAEAAAKGIRPVVQYTTGALDIWPREWVFATHAEAVRMMLDGYDPQQVRRIVGECYPLEARMRAYDRLIEHGSRHGVA